MDKVIFTINGVNIEMDKEAASQAFEAGKVELKSDELVTYSKESFETFKTNLANEEYKKGKAAGEEMPFKYETLKEKFGIEVKGKSLDNFAEAYKEKIIADANIKPNETIKNLEKDLETLRGNYNNLQGDFDSYKQDIQTKNEAQKKDNFLLNMIPTDNLMVDPDIALMALKSKKGIDVTFNESGKGLQTINGEIQKDNSLEPIELSKDFMTEQLTSLNLLKKKEGGNGGDDDTGESKVGSYDKFVKRMSDNGISEGSTEFNEKMQEEMKAGTLKL